MALENPAQTTPTDMSLGLEATSEFTGALSTIFAEVRRLSIELSHRRRENAKIQELAARKEHGARQMSLRLERENARLRAGIYRGAIEVKELRGQVRVLKRENELLRGGVGLDGMDERERDAASESSLGETILMMERETRDIGDQTGRAVEHGSSRSQSVRREYSREMKYLSKEYRLLRDRIEEWQNLDDEWMNQADMK